MTNADYKKMLPILPVEPGVYKYLDAKDKVLYVGKAKNLKKRIASYFGSTKNKIYKVRALVKHAERLEYIVVDSEQDALLLENTLIKKYQPQYNVLMKDGKNYSYIKISKDRFPVLEVVRKVVRDGSSYFGPYTSRYRVRVIVELISKLFRLRTCNLNLSEKNIEADKFTVCLEYHIKNCDGPCAKHETVEAYNAKIVQIKNILRGNFKDVKEHLNAEMDRYSGLLNFEMAQEAKEKLEAFKDYQWKSTVVSTHIRDLDVFNLLEKDDVVYVNYIKVVNGAIINTITIEVVKNLNAELAQIMALAIAKLREDFRSIAPEIVVPFKVNAQLEDEVKYTLPKIGDKQKLMDLSAKNLSYFHIQKLNDQKRNQQKVSSQERVLKTLQKDLGMDKLPFHLECFDNSNIQGTNPTASCVVFKNAKPSKKDYRHFNIKTVEGPNDFASMEEIVYRRYKRMLDEEQTLPQLIVIDGGKGQLSSAVKSLKKLEILDKVTVIGIAKRLEEIFIAGDAIPLYIDKKSESLKLIQQARNESHRFAINHHRNKRSQFFTKSELADIPGIGDKTVEKLLGHFGSTEKVKQAPKEELISVVNVSATKKIMDYFKGEKS